MIEPLDCLRVPCAYHINPDEGLITITGSAEVALSEAILLGKSLMADTQFDPALPQLVDLRGLQVQQFQKDAASFQDFILHTYRKRVQGVIAVVVNDSLDKYALSALYHLTTRVAKGEIFDNYKLALKWLLRQELTASAYSNSLGK